MVCIPREELIEFVQADFIACVVRLFGAGIDRIVTSMRWVSSERLPTVASAGEGAQQRADGPKCVSTTGEKLWPKRCVVRIAEERGRQLERAQNQGCF